MTTTTKTKFQIKSFAGKILYETETTTLCAAVEEAIEKGTNLRGAYLSSADLSGAYLRGAYLSCTNLRCTDLSGAYLRGADLRGAYLSSANLRSANLRCADLSGADLSGADLSGAYLSGGEKWETYLAEVVPALCVAGGRLLSEVATDEHWKCNSWDNCPMAAAFNAKGLDGVPILLRPRAEEFIRLFDAGLIPKPTQPEARP